MYYTDRCHPTPRENLEWDTRLLELVDGDRPGAGCDGPDLAGVGTGTLRSGVLRFWQPSSPLVVAGHSNRRLDEIRIARCRERDIPVFRRSSGGGTVVLGPGCLVYAVVLPIEPGGEVDGIRRTNSFVMEKNRRAVESATGRRIRVAGHTDLVVSGHGGQLRKVSGNSQRRRRSAVLFHGTFLLDFDLSLVAELLDNPRVAPEYRRGRAHAEFLENLDVAPDMIRQSMQQEWGAFSPVPEILG